MEKSELDLLEEYIAAESQEARKSPQLTELCDIIDEIRGLHPPLPASDFVEQTVERIAEKISPRQPRGKFYPAWFKTAGWASAAVAAVLLVTMGVLPYKPTDQLPSLPTPPVQQTVPAPPVEQSVPAPAESFPQLREQGHVAKKQEKAANLNPHNDTIQSERSTIQPENVKDSLRQPAPAPAKVYNKSLVILEQDGEDNKASMAGGVLAEQEPAQSARVIPGEPAAELKGQVPFQVLTIPEHSPEQVIINDNPPGVTMTYKIDRHEVVVRQWMQDATETLKSQAMPVPDQVVLLRRGNIMVEVSGSADRAVLEEVAHSLQ